MSKSFILILLSVLFITSCNFENSLVKKSKVSDIKCPKTLILAPASKIIKEKYTFDLNKNYSMRCFIESEDSSQVFFKINYVIDVSINEVNNIDDNFNFIVFVTNKSEDEKLFEESFRKSVKIEQKKSENYKNITIKNENIDQIILESSIYEQGIKFFIGII